MYGVNSFIMLALVSRVGTVEDAGAFGIAFTTAQLLYIVGLFGVNHYQMTDYDEKYDFASYARVRLFSCVLMLACCACAVLALGFSGVKRIYTICLTVLMLLNACGELYQALFFQKNRLDLSGSALFFRTFWPLVAFATAILLTGKALIAILLQIAANLVITLYYATRVAPKFISGEKKRREKSRDLLIESMPLAVSLFLMNVVINMSKYGIELKLDDTAQGYYNMIFMPAQVINLCSQFVFKPFLNEYAALLKQKQNKVFLWMLGKQVILVGGFTAVCCVGAALLGVPVLGFLYNKDLSGLAAPLTGVVLGGGIYALSQLFYFIMVILRQQRNVLKLYIATTAVSALLTNCLIDWLGIAGAVSAFAGTHVFLLAGYVYQMMRMLREEEK